MYTPASVFFVLSTQVVDNNKTKKFRHVVDSSILSYSNCDFLSTICPPVTYTPLLLLLPFFSFLFYPGGRQQDQQISARHLGNPAPVTQQRDPQALRARAAAARHERRGRGQRRQRHPRTARRVRPPEELSATARVGGPAVPAGKLRQFTLIIAIRY